MGHASASSVPRLPDPPNQPTKMYLWLTQELPVMTVKVMLPRFKPGGGGGWVLVLQPCAELGGVGVPRGVVHTTLPLPAWHIWEAPHARVHHIPLAYGVVYMR